MGREARRVDIPRFFSWKGGDDQHHSAALCCWFCDNGNDHDASELTVIVDGETVARIWLTEREWIELGQRCSQAASSFRDKDD